MYNVIENQLTIFSQESKKNSEYFLTKRGFVKEVLLAPPSSIHLRFRFCSYFIFESTCVCLLRIFVFFMNQKKDVRGLEPLT